MSIKTSKRIALGVIAGLVFAPFAAIAPASAAPGDAATNASIASLTVTNPTLPSVGATAAFTIAVKNATAIAVGTADTFAIRAKITSAPAGGLSAFTGAFVTVTGFQNGAGAVGASGANILTAQKITATLDAGTTTSIGTLTFTPAVAGTYALNFYHDANLDGIQQDNEVFQTASITVGATAIANEIPNSANAVAGADSSLNGVKVSSVGIETVQVSGRTGVQVGFAPQYRLTRNAGTITASNGTGSMTGKVATIFYTVTNPAGTAVTVVSAAGGATASTSQAIAGLADPLLASATANIARTQAISPTTGFPQKGAQVFFSAATAGTYTITAFHDANRDGVISVGEATTSSTVVIAADAIPTITMTTFGQSVPADGAGGGIGHLVRISLRNGTLPASLGLSEVLTITGPAGTVIDTKSARDAATFKLAMGAGSDGVTDTLTQANFDAAGNAYINVGNSTAGGGTYSLTASIAGGTAAGASGSGSFTVIDATLLPVTRTAANTDKLTSFSNTTGVAFGPAGGDVARAVNAGDVTPILNVAPNTAITLSVGYLVGAANTTAVSSTYEAVFQDNFGLVTGVVGAQYKLKTSLGATATTATTRVNFSVALPVIPSNPGVTAATITVLQAQTNATAVTTSFGVQTAAATPTTVLVDPASTTATTYSIRAAIASTNAFTATVMNQYKIAMATQAVTAQVTAGRNAQTVATPLVTDATGKVTFSVADTHTGVLLLTDTLTFTTTTGSIVGTVTINYAATLPVATVAITGGASEDIAPARTTNAINTAIAGAAGTRVTMSATVKDANGGTLPAGVPVTWTISGLTGNSAIWTDTTTGYNWATSLTNSNGVATTFVYAWAKGTVSVTAVAGGITSAKPGSIHFVNAAADARVVSATAAGNVVTAKVVDRYGNTVEGVSITATRTAGAGYFGGNAASSAVASTGANGTVDFVIVGGGATVSVKTTDLNFGQTSSAAGQVNGTAITATSIGATLSPAGVQSATATVAAPVVVVPPVVYDNPTLTVLRDGRNIILSGTAVDGEGDIIIYVKRVGKTAWKERAKTLEVAAPGDFNGTIRAPKNNVLIRVKQEGTGQFSNQVIVVK